MTPDKRFLNLPKSFWAHVRLISQGVGYTKRGEKSIKVPSLQEIQKVFKTLTLGTEHIINAETNKATDFGRLLLKYFRYRADILHRQAEPNLMNVSEAKKAFNTLKKKLRPACPIPMNKQKGKKKTPAYFTGMINMLIEANAANYPCDYDPKVLTTITKQGFPVRTLARRIDGAFPAPVNPIAIWEIKEYYYTTTFGSRVADGVYESLLDGMEIEDLKLNEDIDVKHYLMVDAYYTWWECGCSYLCRIVDMLHMGYIDEVLFGREVIKRVPELAKEWTKLARKNYKPMPQNKRKRK